MPFARARTRRKGRSARVISDCAERTPPGSRSTWADGASPPARSGPAGGAPPVHLHLRGANGEVYREEVRRIGATPLSWSVHVYGLAVAGLWRGISACAERNVQLT